MMGRGAAPPMRGLVARCCPRALPTARPAALALRPRSRLLSAAHDGGVSCDTLSVWLQWDDWLGTGLAMEDSAEQEEFLAGKKIEPQEYFLHAGTPEFAPFQPLHERLYRIAEDFDNAEDPSKMLTVHQGDVVELLEQDGTTDGTGWWNMQVFAGEHMYTGWVPEDVVDHHTQPSDSEGDVFAMGRFWHGDSEGALPVREDTQVAELLEFLSEVAGAEVGLLADGAPLQPTDYVGSSVLNHVVGVSVDGAETGVQINDGHHILPYYSRLEQWDYKMTIEVETLAVRRKTQLAFRVRDS